MSLAQYSKALKLVEDGKVQIDFSQDMTKIYGKVKTPSGIYDVLIDKEIDACTCKFKSFWGIKRSKDCVHLIAFRYRLMKLVEKGT